MERTHFQRGTSLAGVGLSKLSAGRGDAEGSSVVCAGCGENSLPVAGLVWARRRRGGRAVEQCVAADGASRRRPGKLGGGASCSLSLAPAPQLNAVFARPRGGPSVTTG